jgi:hypothetical protein
MGRRFATAFSTVVLLGSTLIPLAVRGQTGPLIDIYNRLEPIGRAYNQPDPLESIDTQAVLIGRVAAVARIALGLLGIIFVALIIYGGYLWMTAAGNEEQVKQARSVLLRAAVGLLITLAAFVITAFVTASLLEATS